MFITEMFVKIECLQKSQFTKLNFLFKQVCLILNRLSSLESQDKLKLIDIYLMYFTYSYIIIYKRSSCSDDDLLMNI